MLAQSPLRVVEAQQGEVTMFAVQGLVGRVHSLVHQEEQQLLAGGRRQRRGMQSKQIARQRVHNLEGILERRPRQDRRTPQLSNTPPLQAEANPRHVKCTSSAKTADVTLQSFQLAR